MFKVQFDSNLEDFDDAIRHIPRAEFLKHLDQIGSSPIDIPSANAVPKILQAMELFSGQRVLHAGAGCGYLAAVMSAHGALVETLEYDRVKVDIARKCAETLRLPNLKIHIGDSPSSLQGSPHFDLILVCQPPLYKPDAFFELVRSGTRMIGLEGKDMHHRELVEYSLRGPGKPLRTVINCINCSRDTGEILIDAGILDHRTLSTAQGEAEAHEIPLIEVVRKVVDCEPGKLYALIASQRGTPLCNFDNLIASADPALFHRFPRAFLEHYRLIPLSMRNDVLSVATSDPDASYEDIKRAFPAYQIEFKLVTPIDFTRLWGSTEIMLQGQELHLLD